MRARLQPGGRDLGRLWPAVGGVPVESGGGRWAVCSGRRAVGDGRRAPVPAAKFSGRPTTQVSPARRSQQPQELTTQPGASEPQRAKEPRGQRAVEPTDPRANATTSQPARQTSKQQTEETAKTLTQANYPAPTVQRDQPTNKPASQPCRQARQANDPVAKQVEQA